VIYVLEFIIKRIQKDKDGIDKDHLPTKRLQISFQSLTDRQNGDEGMDHIGCPECKNDNDRDLGGHIQELI